MDSDGDLAGAQLAGSLLVRESRDYERKHFALAGREQSISLAQLGQFRSLLPRCTIHSQGGIDGLQKFLFAEWFRKNLDCPRLYSSHGRREVAVACDKNDGRRFPAG